MLDINNLYKGFKKVKSGKGAAWIDGQSVGGFADNLEINLKQLQFELQTKQYRAQAVKRVEILKDDGGVKLLGIPAVLDRIVQQTLLNILPSMGSRYGSFQVFWFAWSSTDHKKQHRMD